MPYTLKEIWGKIIHDIKQEQEINEIPSKKILRIKNICK